MDFETIHIVGKLVPYAISYFDVKKDSEKKKIFFFSKSFYLTNYSNNREMLIECIKTLMIRKYHGYLQKKGITIKI